MLHFEYFFQHIICHKQDSVLHGAAAFVGSGIRTCYNLHSTVEMLMTHDGTAVIDAAARFPDIRHMMPKLYNGVITETLISTP